MKDPVIIACAFVIGLLAIAASLDIRAERDLREIEAVHFPAAP